MESIQMLPSEPNPWTGLMHISALTFGTLLSSQGSDAHHQQSLDCLRGNLCNFTGSDRASQTSLPDPATRALVPPDRALGVIQLV